MYSELFITHQNQVRDARRQACVPNSQTVPGSEPANSKLGMITY